jgi:hypothetical protein
MALIRGSKIARPPSSPWRVLVLALLAVGLADCATSPVQVAAREDDLASAGFWPRPADTPARQKMLSSLPPHRFIQRTSAGEISYVYADPLVCGCLYIGSQQAYDLYQSSVQAKNQADEQAALARMYANPDWSWRDWGQTGPAYGPALGW